MTCPSDTSSRAMRSSARKSPIERTTLQMLDRIQAVFTAEFMQSKRGLGNRSAEPIFIVGMPRSGSTLIEQILASHPRVFGAGERTDFTLLISRHRRGA
jgi:hypothetical protein